MRPLWTLLPDRTPMQLTSVSRRKHCHGDDAVGNGDVDKFAEIASERDRNGRHAARLDHKQKRPAVKEGRHRTIGVAQIGILAADFRAPCRELRVNEGRGERDEAAEHPYADNQQRRLDVPRDLGRRNEDPRADDPAHHQHRRVERTEPSREAVGLLSASWARSSGAVDDHVAHRIKARALPTRKRAANSAPRANIIRLSARCDEDQPLLGAEEQHVMVAGDRSAAKRGETDRALLAG